MGLNKGTDIRLQVGELSRRLTLLHMGRQSKNELKNSRPIALVSTVGKVFSGVLKEIVLCKWIERTGVLCEEQWF